MIIETTMGVERALGFVLSYVANNIPTIKAWLEGNPSINNKLEACYQLAVDKWNVDSGTKDAYRQGGMERHIDELKDYIINPQKGKHPKEKELLKKWADYIYADPACNAFILQHKEEIHHAEAQKAILSATELLAELIELENEAHKKMLEKVETLINRGADTCERFWDRKFTDKKGVLPYEVVLGGREKASQRVLAALSDHGVLYIKAETKMEAEAFVAAVVLTNEQNIAEPAIIIEDVQNFKEIADKKSSEIIITTLIDESPWWARNYGHSVLVCMGRNDTKAVSPIVELPSLERDCIVDALKQIGYSDSKARSIAREASYDVSCLCRIIAGGTNETWNTPDNERLLIPAILIGSWDEAFKNDKELVSQMTGMPYDEFRSQLITSVSAAESPFNVVNTAWMLKSPRTMLEAYKRIITIDIIDKFIEKIDWLFEDDDPDAEAKMNAKELQFWKDKHAYAGYIKEGAFHTIALLSLVYADRVEVKNRIKRLVRAKLQDFDLARFLSNQHNMKWIAEAEPEMFLEFLENDIQNGDKISAQLFEIKESNAELTNTRIFYTDLLWCLECIAWDEQLLPRATAILLHYCQYPNTSNWANKPINSLVNIYRFGLPQTFARFDMRYAILQGVAVRYPQYVYALCLQMLRGLDMQVYDVTARFTWRWNERYDDTKLEHVTKQDIEKIVELALQYCAWSKEDIENWLELSAKQIIGFCRGRIMDALSQQVEQMYDDEDIIRTLRKDIIERHTSCRDTFWALKERELMPYQELLEKIVPKDVISRNLHYFEDIYLRDPEEEGVGDYMEYAKKKRVEVLQEIVDQLGEEGIWKLVAKAKSQDAIASGLVAYSEDKYVDEIYARYIKGEVSDALTSRYFRELYYQFGEEWYLKMVARLRGVSEEKIVIVLYAPVFVRSLATIAEQLSAEQETEYWQKVQIWQIDDADASYVLDRMRKVKRYADILQNLFTFNKQISLSERERVAVLCEMYQNGEIRTMMRDAYQVAEVLKTISLPQEQPQRNVILQIEYLLYEYLEHYMQGLSMHLVQELNENPEVLMSIVSMMYLRDEGYREKLTDEEMEYRKELAHVGWSFMYHYHRVPCSDEDGKVDGQKLRKYMERLRELMKENHYEMVMPLVFGKILGDMPEEEDYPSDVMCQLVEELNDDHVDEEIGCALFNRRGMSTRSPFEGGTIERNHIKTLEKYKQRAALLSPRMVKILTNTIASFEDMARREDDQAKRNRLVIV